VYAYHKIFTVAADGNDERLARIKSECKKGTLGCVECKKMLAEVLVHYLDEKIQKRRSGFTEESVKKILTKGAEKAKKVASETMREVMHAVGLA
jgi:tryptophanyl-tRNA synthetase